jgi:hypothetical protein
VVLELVLSPTALDHLVEVQVLPLSGLCLQVGTHGSCPVSSGRPSGPVPQPFPQTSALCHVQHRLADVRVVEGAGAWLLTLL